MASNPFVGPSYNLDSRPASVQRTINMMPVPLEPGNERTGYVFKDVPGLSMVSTFNPSDLIAFLDEFIGSGSIVGHIPEIYPDGFAWADSGLGAVLSGGAAISASAVSDGAATSPFVTTLTPNYSIEFTGGRVSIPGAGTEECAVRIDSTGTDWVQVGLRFDGGAGVARAFISFSGTTEGLYTLPSAGTYELVASITPTSMALSIDGVPQAPIAVTAFTDVDTMSLKLSVDSGVYCRVERVSVINT